MTLGEVALMVSTHLALNTRNCWVQEMVRAFYFGWYDRFVQSDVATRPGASLRRTTAMDLL
jgi:hypothetical protein